MAKQEEEKEYQNGVSKAEEMAKNFKEHSVAEFFNKNKQMLGLYGKLRALTMVVHEYVTNSMDACEESNILPTIDVSIDELGKEYYLVTVKDNGPGLTEKTVGKAFGQLLAGTKFHRLIQTRGQQGIGSAGVTLLSQSTTGKPVKVVTGDGNQTFSVEVMVDTKTNTAKLTNLKKEEKKFQGTALQAKFKNVLYKDSEQSPLEYLRRTAIANPHTEIKFRDPSGNKYTFKRTSTKIPPRPEETKPHPKGVSVDEFLNYSRYSTTNKLSTFLKKEFDRIGDKGLEDIALKSKVDLRKDPKQIVWDEAEAIVKAFKEIDFISPTAKLIPIGEERIRKSLMSIVKPEFLSVLSRKPSVYSGGFPFQVEVSVLYGGGAGRTLKAATEGEKKVELMRFANRVPLLFDQGNCAITDAVNSIDWKRYGIKNIEDSPITILVNFISVHIPYTGAGKQAIASEEEILEEIRLSLMQSGRKTGAYIAYRRREEDKKAKKNVFLKYIPEIASSVSFVTKTKKADLEKMLEKMVIEKLKLEEKKEKESDADLSDEFIEIKQSAENNYKEAEENGTEKED